MYNIYLPSKELYRPFEVEIHYVRPLLETMLFLTDSLTVVKTLRTFIPPNRIDHKEFFWVLLLTRSNRLLGISKIGSGSDTSVIINHKEILQLILRMNASGFIIAHNHPSGTLEASHFDLQETIRIKTLAEIMNVTLLDHLILTSESYLSFSDNGLL